VSDASDVMRVAEYLFEKYKNRDLSSLDKSCKASPVKVMVSQSEHDRILHLYIHDDMSVSELSERFNRSVSVVSVIVNRKHKLYKTRHAFVDKP
jgi:DNA-binding MarR family transcriptional regulator